MSEEAKVDVEEEPVQEEEHEQEEEPVQEEPVKEEPVEESGDKDPVKIWKSFAGARVKGDGHSGKWVIVNYKMEYVADGRGFDSFRDAINMPKKNLIWRYQ